MPRAFFNFLFSTALSTAKNFSEVHNYIFLCIECFQAQNWKYVNEMPLWLYLLCNQQPREIIHFALFLDQVWRRVLLSDTHLAILSFREECGCTPVHYFAILSMQRSGSGWFETLLNNHPNISSHGEIFAVPSRRENFSTIVETLDTIYNLDWLNSASKNECTSAVGLKWMLNQVWHHLQYTP